MCRRGVVVSGVSTVLCLTAAIAWVHSFHSEDATDFVCRGELWELCTANGRLWLDNGPQQHLDRQVPEQQRTRIARLNAELARLGPSIFARKFLGAWPPTERTRQLAQEINRWRGVRTASVAPRAFHVPIDFFTAVFALPPVWQIVMLAVRFLRRRRGLCPWCAYDLRASAQRCPECGRPIGMRLVDPWVSGLWRRIAKFIQPADGLLHRHDPVLAFPRSSIAAKSLYVFGWLAAALMPLAAAWAAQAWCFPSLYRGSWGTWLAWLLAAGACGAIGMGMIYLGCAAERVKGRMK